MLEDLLAIAHLIDHNEDGAFHLTHVERSIDSLTLSLQVATDHYPAIHRQWLVTCTGVREHLLTLGTFYQLQLKADHCLLWAYTTRKYSLYFSGICENADAVIGALYTCHQGLAHEWIPFHRFLNPNVSIQKLITGGSGMLAEGPEPLILPYENILQISGLSASHVDAGEPAYWNGETWQEEREALSVLILDRSYIVARAFSAKKIEQVAK